VYQVRHILYQQARVLPGAHTPTAKGKNMDTDSFGYLDPEYQEWFISWNQEEAWAKSCGFDTAQDYWTATLELEEWYQ
jgi:hypothetical protein